MTSELFLPLRRRSLLAASAAALLGACAGVAPMDADAIVEVASGRGLTREALLTLLHDADFVLLGELHDNERHHARRGELIAALGASSVVLAEQLPRGSQVRFGPDLKQSLVDAGFDAQAWRWPLHRALFAAVERTGATLEGANAASDLVRRVAREGRPALPPELAAVIDAAELTPAARQALEADLVQGHCGHLQGPRLHLMQTAQRVRDATMWLALRDARDAQPAPRRAPVVLVAGNGHVRTDYGVAQLAARLRPAARVVSVGFGETGDRAEGEPVHYLWITARETREDPCRDMQRRMNTTA